MAQSAFWQEGLVTPVREADRDHLVAIALDTDSEPPSGGKGTVIADVCTDRTDHRRELALSVGGTGAVKLFPSRFFPIVKR